MRCRSASASSRARPRQGRVGVGYSTVYAIDFAPADDATLTVVEVDRAIDEIEHATGPGSARKRSELLADLLGRATAEEAAFLQRLFTGELRQGALAGIMADAIAKAAGVPGEIVRRALMLSGDLTRMAQVAMTDGEEGLRAVGFEIFRPILPMLASTGATVSEAMSSFERASVEWKLDGIRIQIHRRDRGGSYLHAQPQRHHRDAARDRRDGACSSRSARRCSTGRRCGCATGGPAAFQETVSQIDSDAPPEGIVTFLFDLLHLDGEDLLDVPLVERQARLAAIAPETDDPATS